MAVIAELRVVAAIAAGRIDLIQGSYADGCGILVSGDCSVTGFWRDALGAVPHMGEACVPLSVLSAYCCGSGWPSPSALFVITNESPESAAGSAIVFFKDNAQDSAGTLRTGTSCLRQ